MTLLAFAGCEVDVQGGIGGVDVDGVGTTAGTGTITRDTGTFKTGLASWKCQNGATANSQAVAAFTASNTNGVSYFLRIYLNVTTMPTTSSCQPVELSGISCRLTTGGTLQLFNGVGGSGSQVGSDSSALSTGVWYRIEMMYTVSGGVITDLELRLDGTTVASASGQSLTTSTSLSIGLGRIGASSASTVLFVDDFAYCNSSGAANNTWLADTCLSVLMPPISDNNRGAWVAGAGGTTNLFAGADNTPPVGVADGSATDTSQIKNKSTTNPTNCDLNLDTYTSALGAGVTVNGIRLVACHGEDPATGTKAGTIAMVSNPAIGTTSFNFGNDLGAQGTYSGNWRYALSTITDTPSVTLGTAPVIRITCVSGATATRAASCCLLASYVAYTAAVAAGVEAPAIIALQAVNRGATW